MKVTQDYLNECTDRAHSIHGDIPYEYRDVSVNDLTKRIHALVSHIENENKASLKSAIKNAINKHSKHKVKKVWSIKKEESQTLWGGETLLIEVELKRKD